MVFDQSLPRSLDVGRAVSRVSDTLNTGAPRSYCARCLTLMGIRTDWNSGLKKSQSGSRLLRGLVHPLRGRCGPRLPLHRPRRRQSRPAVPGSCARWVCRLRPPRVRRSRYALSDIASRATVPRPPGMLVDGLENRRICGEWVSLLALISGMLGGKETRREETRDLMERL